MTVEPRVAASTPPAGGTSSPPRSRRALLVAAIGGAVGVVAGALGRPQVASAAPGDSMRVGRSNDGGADQTILLSTAGGAAFTLKDTAVGGTGQFGWSSATTGAGRGLYGRSDSASGSGVSAVNSAGSFADGAALRATASGTYAILATTNHNDAAVIRAFHSGTLGTGVLGTGENRGVYGIGTNNGVVGQSTTGFGTLGSTESGVGARGVATANGDGVYGSTSSGAGVRGIATSGYGVVGTSTTEAVRGISAAGVGVVGGSTSGTGVYGESASGYAGSFVGDVFVSGTIDGALLSTTIDHPLDPAERLLQLAAIDSPERLVLTSGRVELDDGGRATVRLPAWFAAMHEDARHQLTAIGAAMPDLHLASVDDDRFEVAGGAPGGRVGWQVTGVRRDAWAVANPVRLERAKRGKERGRYVHPAAHGKGADRSLAGLHGPKVSVHEPMEVPTTPALDD
jgi:hypothetical protein